MNNPTQQRNPNGTSKDKRHIEADLGLSKFSLEEKTISWVPVAMDDETRRLLQAVSQVRKDKGQKIFKVHAILSELAENAMGMMINDWKEETKHLVEKMRAEKTPEQLKGEMEALKRKMELIQKALAEKK